MKSRIMKVVILFLAVVIAIDIFVLLTNDSEKEKYTINNTNTDELKKELNETIEKNKDKIERYEKIVEWNKIITENLK